MFPASSKACLKVGSRRLKVCGHALQGAAGVAPGQEKTFREDWKNDETQKYWEGYAH